MMQVTTPISDKPPTKELVPCRSRADVDNQLGILHDVLGNPMNLYNVNIGNTHYVNDAHDDDISILSITNIITCLLRMMWYHCH